MWRGRVFGLTIKFGQLGKAGLAIWLSQSKLLKEVVDFDHLRKVKPVSDRLPQLLFQ